MPTTGDRSSRLSRPRERASRYPRRGDRSEIHRRAGRRPAAPPAPGRGPVVVGRQHLRHRGERAAPAVEAELALSDALADPDLFRGGVGRRARRGGGARRPPARPRSTRSLVPHRCPKGCGTGSSSSRRPSSRASRSTAARSAAVGRRQRDQADPARERRRRRAPGGVGGVEDRRRRGRRRRARARAAPQRGGTLPRLIATGSPSPSRRRRWTRRGSSGRSTSATGSPADAFARWKAATDAGSRAVRLRAWTSFGPGTYEAPSSRRSRQPAASTSSGVFAGKDVVELARETFDGIGLDTGAILDRSDLFPRDGKCQHAFCIDVDREGDVRVLANVEHDRLLGGHDAPRARARRVRHRLRPSLPWLLRDCHLTVTEGIAIMMGRLAQDAEWLREVAGLEPADAAALDAPSPGRAGRRAARLHPLGARDDELRARVLRRPRGRPRRDSGGGSSRATSSSRPRTAGTRRTGRRRSTSPARRSTTTPISTGTSSRPSSGPRSTGRRRAGRPTRGRAFLAERVFRPAQSLRWDRLLEPATGEPLTATHLARAIARRARRLRGSVR